MMPLPLFIFVIAAQGSGCAEPSMYPEKRTWLLRELRDTGIDDERVLGAIRSVPRHCFVPQPLLERSYDNRALPIGEGQTISQPYVVAYMTAQLELPPHAKVLEVGTGSGYQAAVLAELGATVFSIEIVPSLAERAAGTLARLGYRGVTVRAGDGYRGWPEEAPFDAIIITAAAAEVPQPLTDQLKPGGKMILPLSKGFQRLLLLRKTKDGRVERKELLPVAFVPMIGEIDRRQGQ